MIPERIHSRLHRKEDTLNDRIRILRLGVTYIMKYSARLSDAVHLLTFIYLNPKNDLSSATIAVSIRTNPSYVRQLMMALRKSGLLSSTRGQARPELTKSPEELTLLDIYRAVEGNKPLLHLDTHINPECNVGVNIQIVLSDYYNEVQAAAEAKMQQITLSDIIRDFYEKVGNPTPELMNQLDWD